MTGEEREKLIKKALNTAWHLGQAYWAQADSEYLSQQKKSEETLAMYRALIVDTIAVLDPDRE
jgi:hypothetical protein